jgi:hypothetical protein
VRCLARAAENKAIEIEPPIVLKSEDVFRSDDVKSNSPQLARTQERAREPRVKFMRWKNALIHIGDTSMQSIDDSQTEIRYDMAKRAKKVIRITFDEDYLVRSVSNQPNAFLLQTCF